MTVKGATKELNDADCVFSLPGEAQVTKQWRGMMDLLSLYASTHFSTINCYLDVLFNKTDPKLPSVSFSHPFRSAMPDAPKDTALEEVLAAHQEEVNLLNKMAQKIGDKQVKEFKAKFVV